MDDLRYSESLEILNDLNLLLQSDEALAICPSSVEGCFEDSESLEVLSDLDLLLQSNEALAICPSSVEGCFEDYESLEDCPFLFYDLEHCSDVSSDVGLVLA